MRVGILSDAHGNIAGLEKCVRFLARQHVSRYLFLGDAIGYFPHDQAVCALLASIPVVMVEGNNEAMLSGILPMTDAMREIIRPPDAGEPHIRKWLHLCKAVGPRRLLTIDGKRLYLVHAGLEDPYTGRMDKAAAAALKDCDAILAGHTHRPEVTYLEDGKLLLNPGSCGYPRDNGAWLSVAVLETQDLSASVYRIPNVVDEKTLQQVHPTVAETLKRDFPIFGTKVEDT